MARSTSKMVKAVSRAGLSSMDAFFWGYAWIVAVATSCGKQQQIWRSKIPEKSPVRYYAHMATIHQFPSDTPKKTRAAKSGTPYLFVDEDGEQVDVLVSIQIGGMFLTEAEDSDPENDMPSAHLQRTEYALDLLTNLADILIREARAHPDQCSLDNADELEQLEFKTDKVMRKIVEAFIPDHLVITIPSNGPVFLAEFLTLSAVALVSDYALSLLRFYEINWIDTRKDKRKRFFKDFQEAYLDAHEQAMRQLDDLQMMMRNLASVQRALGKYLKE
ncbi:hypothetical protein JKG47_05110 [Acidithiobacillus sp. MC6.1]|nr:hypothetical protein [Acidithiobacillus sp. MC6.1]